jgi:exocyst complex component 4
VPVLSGTDSPATTNAIAGPGPSSRFSRYLTSLTTRPAPDRTFLDPNSARPESETTDTNPEADSYRYIELILEALFVMGKLNSALDTVTQRVATEIHHLIESTLDEVDERYVLGLESANAHRSEQRREEEAVSLQPEMQSTKSSRRQSIFSPSDTLRIAVSLDAMGPPRHAAILKDLFWTLYSKLAAVLEAHRVVYEVARWIPSVSIALCYS